MAETGYVALILALAACIFSITAYIFGLRTSRTRMVDYAGKGAIAAAALFSLSVVVLIIALISHQFQIEYVALYTSTDMTLPYLVSALWAGNAGSLFFWGWIISLCAAIIVIRKRKRGQELVPHAALIVIIVQSFFLGLLIFALNPFHKLDFLPTEGLGLNPLLENPGMIFHVVPSKWKKIKAQRPANTGGCVRLYPKDMRLLVAQIKCLIEKGEPKVGRVVTKGPQKEAPE